MDSDKHSAIVFEPIGRPLKNEKLTTTRIRQMFQCVKELHSKGVIHRDLSPSHFYIANDKNGQEYVFVIDLGSAILMDEDNLNKELNSSNMEEQNADSYEGSIQYAAKDILNQYLSDELVNFFLKKCS